MSRFLTKDEKELTLAQWEETLHTEKGRGTTNNGATGLPDALIIPWCEKVNELTGICTVQSCAGHQHTDITYSGHLWLRLDADNSFRFDVHAFSLSAHEYIENVSRLYSRHGQEITGIQFWGAERNHLDRSMLTVLNFLRFIVSERDDE